MKSSVPSRRDFLRTTSGLAAALSTSVVVGDDAAEPRVPGLEFVRVEPGRFPMGNPGPRESEENPVSREVVIARPFAISTTPVAQSVHEWLLGAAANPSRFRDDPAQPVESIGWLDVIRFCNALSERVGLMPAFEIEGDEVRGLPANGFRLPLEAEWEYACRAGTTTVYCCGDDADQLPEYAWYNRGAKGTTKPVGQKRANAWGLHDVHGNVDEWCWDWFGPIRGSAGTTTPAGPPDGIFRVIRGGSYLPDAHGLRSSLRGRAVPDCRAATIGFRLVRSLPYANPE